MFAAAPRFAICLIIVAVVYGCGRVTDNKPRIDRPAQVAKGDATNEPSALIVGNGVAPNGDNVVAKAEYSGRQDWPLFRGDAQATGVTDAELREPLEVVWKLSIPNGIFEATAAIDNGTVYVGCLDGHFYAVDLEIGKERWRFPTDLGFRAATAVRHGAVYVGDEDGRFFCLDAATGKMRWTFPTNAEIDSAANFHGENVIFGSQDATLYCLKADSGELVWKHTIDDQIRCMPTVVEDRAFVAGCDGKLHIIDLVKGDKIGTVDIQSPTGSTPAVMGDLVYFGTEGETFFGIDWRAQQIVWTYRNPQRPFPYRSSAAVTAKRVIVGSRDKLVHAFDPASGRELWTFATGSRIDSSPVVVGDRVYFGSADGRLYALDVENAKKVWEYEAGGGFSASPAVVAGRLVIGNEDGVLFCFGPAPREG